MRNTTISLLIGVVIFATAVPAEAQRTQPAKQVSHQTPEGGTVAIAGSFSPTKTESAFLDNGLGFAGSVEGYVARFLSVRGQVGAAFWDIDGLSFDGTLRPVYALGNLVAGWTAGDWRPYVTGGGGVYRYEFNEAGVGGSTTKSGWDAGAGVEYFFSPEATVTFETLFNNVELIPTNRATLGFKGSFWVASVGVKKYF